MERECPKCGAMNAQATGDAAETCPQCGVIYAKAALVAAQQRLADKQAARVGASRGKTGWLESLLWGLTTFGGLVGLGQLLLTLALATSAPQQAAGAAMAVAMAAVPYCLARAEQARRSAREK